MVHERVDVFTFTNKFKALAENGVALAMQVWRTAAAAASHD